MICSLIQTKFPRQGVQLCHSQFYESVIWEQQRLFLCGFFFFSSDRKQRLRKTSQLLRIGTTALGEVLPISIWSVINAIACLMRVISLLLLSATMFPGTRTSRSATAAGAVSSSQPSSHPSPGCNVQGSPLHPSPQLSVLSAVESER